MSKLSLLFILLTQTSIPFFLLFQCYGIWDHESLGSTIVTKLESTDIMDFVEPCLTGSTVTDCSGVVTLQNQTSQNTNRTDYDFQAQQYLNAFPPLGNDPYSTPDSQILDNFQCIGNMDSPFHRRKFGPVTKNYRK